MTLIYEQLDLLWIHKWIGEHTELILTDKPYVKEMDKDTTMEGFPSTLTRSYLKSSFLYFFIKPKLSSFSQVN